MIGIRELAVGLILEVALQAQGRIALGEHFLVHGTVRVVAGGAAFADGVMGEHERTALLGVALEQVSFLPVSWVPPPLMAQPLCGSWQSPQVILPDSTGWL